MRILPFALFEATKGGGHKPLTTKQKQFLDRYTWGNWTWNPETGVVDILGNFSIESSRRKDFGGVKFGFISGDFSCGWNKLTSLEGGPEKVGGNFHCPRTELTSLTGAPKKVGGNFNCGWGELTSLEGSPEEVGGDFECDRNQLKSLKGGPEKVGGKFNCIWNELTSLEGSPEEVGGGFDCRFNKLTSLKGAPERIDGRFQSSSFELEDWSIGGFLDLLKGKGDIRNLDETRSLVLEAFSSLVRSLSPSLNKIKMSPEELYQSISRLENRNEIFSIIRKENPQIWDRIKGFGGRSSLSADMGDLFF